MKGQKRFTSTIARRLDTLGAITKGERETGGQGLFDAADNLEGDLAADALRIFFKRLVREEFDGIGIAAFQTMTGLRITDDLGALRDDLPTIQRFLNRLLALPIAAQNTLFGVFERILSDRTEAARLAGTLDEGSEVLQGDSLVVTSDDLLTTDAATGAETRLVQIDRECHTRAICLAAALASAEPEAFLARQRETRRVRLLTEISPHFSEDGTVRRRFSVVGPEERSWIYERTAEQHYTPCSRESAETAWSAEVESIPATRADTVILLTGLLLPLWKNLPSDRQTVYRVRTDDGRTLLGRAIPVALKDALLAVHGGASGSNASQVLRALDTGERYPITNDCWLQVRRVMDAKRVEIVNPTPEMFDLRQDGAFTEVIDYRTRLFLPRGDDLERLIDRVILRFRTVG